MAGSLEGHPDAVRLAHDVHRITAAPPEGTNNTIRTLNRLAYRFRDRQSCMHKPLAGHETTCTFFG